MNTTDAFVPLLTLVILILSMIVDMVRLRSDVPTKRLEGLLKSFDLLQKDNEFLRIREAHHLDYISYLWQWIEKTIKLVSSIFKELKIKRKIPDAPKKFEDFIQKKYFDEA